MRERPASLPKAMSPARLAPPKRELVCRARMLHCAHRPSAMLAISRASRSTTGSVESLSQQACETPGRTRKRRKAVRRRRLVKPAAMCSSTCAVTVGRIPKTIRYEGQQSNYPRLPALECRFARHSGGGGRSLLLLPADQRSFQLCCIIRLD